MTVSELYKQVAQLGFEDVLEENSRFYYAANRAILQVASIRPAISSCVIHHKPMKNLLLNSSFSPQEKTEPLCFEAIDAKAFYFEADGEGIVYVEGYDEDNGEWTELKHIELSSDKTFVPYKDFIKWDGEFFTGRVRLRFTGEYLYSVKSVALYRHLYSNDREDIPAYEAYTRYDISSLTRDFLSLCSPPIEGEERERLNQNYDVEDGRVILLPYGVQGCYKVLYRRRPRAIVLQVDAAEDTAVIDLDEELCSLLPTLVASYVWVEDEPSMAQYYLTLYRERAIDVERRITNSAPVTIKNTSGW